jgi:hypothetical protein
MSKINRRYFLLAAAALPVGCALRRPGVDAPNAAAASIRGPAAGQSWRYSKHDGLTRALVDIQIDTVNAVGSTVSIDSRSDTESAENHGHSWGMAWLRKSFGQHRPSVTVASEIQEPWGMILVDPHWGEVQVFETPVPLWPTELRRGWHSRVSTRYKTPSHEGSGMEWDQTITAHDWESITVPAGRFTALRFTNLINFTSSDFGRTSSTRRETVWFAPQVGRWVARESRGTYYLTESVADQPYYENNFRWELLEFT